MRVTNSMVNRNYLTGLQRNYNQLNKYSEQVYTGRKYSRMSEDTSSAVRAMQVRRKMAQIPGYIDNANSTNSKFAAAEKTLLQVSDLNKSVSDLFVQGMSDNNGQDERNVMAQQIEKLQEELLTLANGEFAGQRLFGGTNTVSAPFTLEGTPKELYYNGKAVSQITNPNDPLLTDKAFVDLGLGLEKDINSSTGDIKENTLFKNTIVGLEFMGTGDDNLYNLMGEMAQMLRDGVPDKEAAGALLDKFRDATNKSNLVVTSLGADTQYLEFTVDRLETEELNLIERQQNLELVSPDEAIINFKMQEFVYNAALQMGQRLLQPTLFSFIN